MRLLQVAFELLEPESADRAINDAMIAAERHLDRRLDRRSKRVQARAERLEQNRRLTRLLLAQGAFSSLRLQV